MKTAEHKANTAFRRSAKRAQKTGKARDEYRAQRVRIASARALLAEQYETTNQ